MDRDTEKAAIIIKGILDARSLCWRKMEAILWIIHSAVNLAARFLSGDWIIVYLSSQVSFAINMEKMVAGDLVDVCWMNPVTGEQTKIGRFSNTGTQSLTTPDGWEDAVLLLETATH